MHVDKLRRVALGHVKATLDSFGHAFVPAGHDMQVGAESNLNSPAPRVRAIRQLPFRAPALSTVVRPRVSTSEYKSRFWLSTVRCEVRRRC